MREFYRKISSFGDGFSEEERGVGFAYGVAALVLYAAIFGLVLWHDGNLPDVYVSQNHLMFDANKTFDFLQRLVAIGPRVAGSRENEIIAVNFLLEEIDKIIAKSHAARIKRKVEVVSGAYYLDFKPYGSINVYRNFKNVVVKIWSGFDTGNSVLVNSHFDSVPDSPGGSDDGAMVSIMMDMLRIFSSWDPLKQDLVLLFNGAEETAMQASHGFVTSDEWAKDVRVVVNLESTGVGGKEMLFQTGPGRTDLMHYYKQVPRPHAQAAGEELFQRNIIPSDTDFRVFRDFGKYIGFDMAYSREGYRYHTKYDDGNVDVSVLQHTGDNLRKLLQGLVFDHDFSSRNQAVPGTIVYYDFMGFLLIHYSGTTAIIFNTLTVVVALASFIYALVKFDICRDVRYVIVTVLGLIVTYLVSIAFVLLLGAGLDWTSFTMRWYNSSWLLLGLYCAPVVLLNFVGVFLLNRFNKKEGFTLDLQTQFLLQSNNLIWAIILLVGTALEIRSVYVFLYHVLFSSVAFLLINVFKLHSKGAIWKLTYAIFMVLPITFSFQVAFEIVFLFIPICGRKGGSANPELLVAAICFFLTILATSYYMPLLATVKHYVYILATILSVFVLFLLLAHTPVTFPYDVSNEPRPQRYPIYHTSRRIRNETSIILEDSGITFPLNDRNTKSVISDFIKNFSTLHEDCQTSLYCGVAISSSRSIKDLEDNIWVPAGQPALNFPTVDLKVLKKTVKDDIVTFDFHALGPDRMCIYFSPRPGVELAGIDLLDFLPPAGITWKGRPTYYLSFGSGDLEGLKFSLRLKASSAAGFLLDIAVAGKYLHDVEISQEYRDFIDRFPKWAFVNPWVAHYESWVL